MANRLRRCALRASVAGYYDAGDHAITLHYGKQTQDPSPFVTVTHELVHKDLTESTVSGIVERYLAGSSQGTDLPIAAKKRLRGLLDTLVDGSMLVHEGTALYISLAQMVLIRQPHLPSILKAVPDDYRKMLNEIESWLIPLDELQKFGGIDDELLNYSIGLDVLAKAFARAALDFTMPVFTNDEDVIGRLESAFDEIRADERYRTVAKSLKGEGQVTQLLAAAVAQARNLNLVGRGPFDIEARNADLEKLHDHIRQRLYPHCPTLGPYQSREERGRTAVAIAEAIRSGLSRQLGVFIPGANIQHVVNPVIDARSAAPGALRDKWFMDAPVVPSSRREIRKWLTDLLAWARQTNIIHTVHVLVYIHLHENSLTLPNKHTLTAGDAVFHITRRMLPAVYGGGEPTSNDIAETDAALPRSCFTTRISDVVDAISDVPSISASVSWHLAMPYLSGPGLVDQAMVYAVEVYRDMAEMLPAGMGARFFHMDEAGTKLMQAVMQNLHKRSKVTLYRSLIFEDGDVFPLVGKEDGRDGFWVILASQQLSTKMAVEVFGSSAGTEVLVNAVGGYEHEQPQTHLALDYIYNIRW